MRHWDLENCVWKSIYHSRYGRYRSQSGGDPHLHEGFYTQSGTTFPWFILSARILHLVRIFILHLPFPSTPLPSSQQPKVKSSLSISPYHDHHLTLSTAYTEYSIFRVQHTLSTVYTEYSIHRVQHTPSTAYTGYDITPQLFVFPSFWWLRVDRWM